MTLGKLLDGSELRVSPTIKISECLSYGSSRVVVRIQCQKVRKTPRLCSYEHNFMYPLGSLLLSPLGGDRKCTKASCLMCSPQSLALSLGEPEGQLILPLQSSECSSIE